MPAALAVAERDGLSGRSVLGSIAVGYEIAIRIGAVVGKRHYHYFHNTSTCGVFGAAAAVSGLLNLGREPIVWALGNAGTQAGGLWEFNADGAMSKHLHAGKAAANGLLAADLASRGFTGAREILEGPRGFFKATAPDADPDVVLDGLDPSRRELKIAGVSIKPYPSCRHTHPAIDAALQIHPQIQGRPIKRVEIRTYQAAIDLCDNSSQHSSRTAKFSLQYCCSLALHRGSVELDDFERVGHDDPRLSDLSSSTVLKLDAGLEAMYPVKWAARVRVDMIDGESIEACVDHPKGDPENPLTSEELREKFRQLARFGGKEGWIEPLVSWVGSLADAAEVSLPTYTSFL